MIDSWVWLKNLEPLVDEIAALVGASLDGDVKQMFFADVKASDTDASPERWASCQLLQSKSAVLFLGIDQGTDVLRVRFDAPDELSARLDTIIDLMQSYLLSRRD